MSVLQSRRPPPLAGTVFLVLGVLGLAAFLGLTTAVLPWFLTVLLVVVPTMLLLSAAFPWVGLLFALALLFEVIPRAFVPQLPLVGGRLQGHDILLLYLAALFVIRSLIRPGSTPLKDIGAFRFPLYYLAVMLASSLVYARYFAQNEFALTEARAAIVWLVIPLAAAFFPGAKGLKRLVAGVAVFGLIISLYVSIQSLFDIRIMTAARVESLDIANRDVTRSIAGGGVYLIIFSLFFFLNRLVDRPRQVWWLLPAVTLTLMALAFQFGRGVWVATAVGVLLSAWMHRGWSGAGRIVLIGGLALSVLITGLSFVRPRIVDALEARLLGIGTEVARGGSFRWRLIENDEALRRIAQSPLTGVGIGGDYKDVVSSAGSFDVETRYIHNGYLYFPLKMGVFASFIPLAFIGAFLWTVRRAGRHKQHPRSDRALLAALTGAFAVPVITSFTQPEWVAVQGIGAFSVLMAMMLLYSRQVETAQPAAEAVAGVRVPR